MRIRPFRAFRPPAALAARVASPPYDVVDAGEARRIAQGNDACFLRVVRPEIDFSPGLNLYDESVYRRAGENLHEFIDAGYLCKDPEPGMFLYRQVMGGQSQTGLVTTCMAEEYDQDVILKHERTLPRKEDDRVRHMEALNAQTGPVFLTYREEEQVDLLVSRELQSDPIFDFTDDAGVGHTGWAVLDPDAFVEAFSSVPAAYVADGHHRCASAARVAKARRESNPRHRGDEPYNWFLSVLFPANQLNVLAYNRVVRDLNGQTPSEFIGALTRSFELKEDAESVPGAPRGVSLYIDGAWHGIEWDPAGNSDPVSTLDVSLLQNEILGPLLGIDDPRTSERIQFVGGIHGAKRLQELVDSGEAAAAFSMYPTSIRDLMRVADAGKVMPPKSTWFEPKLKSGLFVHTFE